MNEVYVVLNDLNGNTDLFRVYASFGGARRAISNWAGGDGKWISEDCYESNYDGTYRIIARAIEP